MRAFRLALAAALLLAATGMLAVAPSVDAAESSLTFDLSAASDHAASILWNIKTNNITRERLTGWNSSWLDEPGDLEGTVVVDVEAGSVTGTITERWSCHLDCEGWTYRDATMTASITNGQIADGEIVGKVAIRYEVEAGRDEPPSDCGGFTCYNCADQFCTLKITVDSTAALAGGLLNDSLSLSFVDRLAEDPFTMDLEPLREVEFVMARFSVAGIPASLAPVEPQSSDSTEEATSREEGSASPDDPAAGTGEPTESGDVSDGAPDDASAEESLPIEVDGDGIGALTAIGLAVAVLLLWAALYPRARRWYKHLVERMIEGIRSSLRREQSPPKPPADPAYKSYVVDGEERIYKTTVEQIPPPKPPQVFQIMGHADTGYQWVEGRSPDGKTVTRLNTGDKVTVVARTERLALVRLTGGGTPIWIDRAHIQGINPHQKPD